MTWSRFRIRLYLGHSIYDVSACIEIKSRKTSTMIFIWYLYDALYEAWCWLGNGLILFRTYRLQCVLAELNSHESLPQVMTSKVNFVVQIIFLCVNQVLNIKKQHDSFKSWYLVSIQVLYRSLVISVFCKD